MYLTACQMWAGSNKCMRQTLLLYSSQKSSCMSRLLSDSKHAAFVSKFMMVDCRQFFCCLYAPKEQATHPWLLRDMVYQDRNTRNGTRAYAHCHQQHVSFKKDPLFLDSTTWIINMALKLPPYALHSQIISARPLLPRSVLPFSSVVVSGTETTTWSMQAKRLNEMKQERRVVSLYIWAER